MHVQVQKWGNSLAFRIPSAFAHEADICQGTTVDLGLEEGRLIVTPLRKKVVLKDLLLKVDRGNIHGEEDLGQKRGAEIW